MMFSPSQKSIDKMNIIRALKEQPLIKVCIHCKHYKWIRCHRKRVLSYNNITGKRQVLGDRLFCTIEREVETKHESLVFSQVLCGAIGQFWEPKKPSFHWLPKIFCFNK